MPRFAGPGIHRRCWRDHRSGRQTPEAVRLPIERRFVLRCGGSQSISSLQVSSRNAPWSRSRFFHEARNAVQPALAAEGNNPATISSTAPLVSITRPISAPCTNRCGFRRAPLLYIARRRFFMGTLRVEHSPNSVDKPPHRLRTVFFFTDKHSRLKPDAPKSEGTVWFQDMP